MEGGGGCPWARVRFLPLPSSFALYLYKSSEAWPWAFLPLPQQWNEFASCERRVCILHLSSSNCFFRSFPNPNLSHIPSRGLGIIPSVKRLVRKYRWPLCLGFLGMLTSLDNAHLAFKKFIKISVVSCLCLFIFPPILCQRHNSVHVRCVFGGTCHPLEFSSRSDLTTLAVWWAQDKLWFCRSSFHLSSNVRVDILNILLRSTFWVEVETTLIIFNYNYVRVSFISINPL